MFNYNTVMSSSKQTTMHKSEEIKLFYSKTYPHCSTKTEVLSNAQRSRDIIITITFFEFVEKVFIWDNSIDETSKFEGKE